MAALIEKMWFMLPTSVTVRAFISVSLPELHKDRLVKRHKRRLVLNTKAFLRDWWGPWLRGFYPCSHLKSDSSAEMQCLLSVPIWLCYSCFVGFLFVWSLSFCFRGLVWVFFWLFLFVWVFGGGGCLGFLFLFFWWGVWGFFFCGIW